MAYNSAAVSAGDDILASQYNNLRTDLTEIRDADRNIFIPTDKYLYFDDGGDTYFYGTVSGSNDVVVVKVHGQTLMSFNSDGSDDIVRMEPGTELQFAGGNDDYLVGIVGRITVYIGGNEILQFNSDGVAPGANEAMMWDVIIFSLDGGSADTVTYAIDESKIYGMLSIGHETAAIAYSSTDQTADANDFTKAYINANTLYIAYGGSYGAGDAAQIIMFYVP